MTGQLLTARVVADLFDVTPATVLRWTRDGELPAVRLPSGQIRYREDELDAWMVERATPARGARTTTADATHAGRYLPGSTDANAPPDDLPSTVRTTTPHLAAAEDEE